MCNRDLALAVNWYAVGRFIRDERGVLLPLLRSRQRAGCAGLRSLCTDKCTHALFSPQVHGMSALHASTTVPAVVLTWVRQKYGVLQSFNHISATLRVTALAAAADHVTLWHWPKIATLKAQTSRNWQQLCRRALLNWCMCLSRHHVLLVIATSLIVDRPRCSNAKAQELGFIAVYSRIPHSQFVRHQPAICHTARPTNVRASD